jgi:2-phospho-L-lactate/phosphoenolpyruvate guanylyltransferase
MSRSTVLVPLRSPGRGKTRLAPVLSPLERASLAGAMLADVAAALAAADCDEVVVVAGGPAAAAAAAALGLEVLVDPPDVPGLDGALRAAALRIGPVPELLVVAADLPALTAPDVEAIRARDAAVVVAPTRDGGTGVLLRRPGDAIATRYGPGSAARHLALARRGGLTTATVHRTGTATDVDVGADLAALRATAVGPTTRRVLAALRPDIPATG